MKTPLKIIWMLFLSCLFWGPGWCAPWGALADYAEETKTLKIGDKYLLRKILDGKTLSIGLPRTEVIGTNENYEKLEKMIKDAYNEWFLNATYHIETSQREDEFADILPLLRRGIPVQISEHGKDLDIVFLPYLEIPKHCSSESGCYKNASNGRKIPLIYLLYDDGFVKVLSLGRKDKKTIGLHEIGHSLGLSDQYVKSSSRSINTDAMYSSIEDRKSIMENFHHLTCDDADGIINLIDITNGVRRGGDSGWKTLCPQSQEYYIGGISAAKGAYRLELSNQAEAIEVITYEKGKKASTKVFPFAKPQEAVEWKETPVAKEREWDALGRPVLADGPDGEIIYYTYLYDRIERLTIKDGLALNFVTQLHYSFNPEKGGVKDHKEMIFGQKSSLCFLRMQVLFKKGYFSEYIEGLEKPEPIRYMRRSYNQKDVLVEDVYDEPLKQQAGGSVATSAKDSALKKEIGNGAKSSLRQQLVTQLDQWTRQALKELRNGKKDELK